MMVDRTYLMDSDVFITAKNYRLNRRPSERSHRDDCWSRSPSESELGLDFRNLMQPPSRIVDRTDRC